MTRASGKWLPALGWLLWLVIIGVVGVGIYMVGSPAQARREKVDLERVNDLQELAFAVRSCARSTELLPESLEPAYRFARQPEDQLRDPETRASYGYRLVDPEHFELCANFQTDQSGNRANGYYGVNGEFAPIWRHKRGRQCVTLERKEPRE